MNPRNSPNVRNGQISPPTSTKSTMEYPTSDMDSTHGSSQTSPNPPMRLHQPQARAPVHSPPLKNFKPYPAPSSQSTQVEDPDRTAFLEFKRSRNLRDISERQEQLRRQRQQAMSMHDDYLPYRTSSPAELPRSHLPPLRQRHDSGYASVDSYHQPSWPNSSPPPQTQPQTEQQNYVNSWSTPPQTQPQTQSYVHPVAAGHNFGVINARGSAQILMGNSISDRPTQHNYGGLNAYDNVQVFTGDVTEQQMLGFFRRPR